MYDPTSSSSSSFLFFFSFFFSRWASDTYIHYGFLTAPTDPALLFLSSLLFFYLPLACPFLFSSFLLFPLFFLLGPLSSSISSLVSDRILHFRPPPDQTTVRHWSISTTHPTASSPTSSTHRRQKTQTEIKKNLCSCNHSPCLPFSVQELVTRPWPNDPTAPAWYHAHAHIWPHIIPPRPFSMETLRPQEKSNLALSAR